MKFEKCTKYGCLAFLLVMFVSTQAFCQVPLEGYDHNKLNNPNHKTPKYLFGRVAQKYSLNEVRSKEAGEALLRRMLPEMQAAGLEIAVVKGDKILVKTDIGWEWVDVIRGAGGGNPGWWWGSEGKPITGPAPTPLPSSGVISGGIGPVLGTFCPHCGGRLDGLPGQGNPGTGGGEPGKPLETVPSKPEYSQANIDTSSDEAAIISAARWVKENHSDLFVEGDDRDKAYEMMTVLIGVLRAKGYDVHRVVNHPSRPVGNPWRYGSDALVLKGTVYDCYAALGDPNRSTPQALNVGKYDSNRLRE